MLLDADKAVEILQAVREALPAQVPTTISLRRGFDESAESVERFWRIMETAWEQGYSAVRVHARTVEQKYVGRADWGFLKEVKAKYPERTILGSGDVFTAEDAVRMKRETGVDIVWIARGAIGNPWIFGQAGELMKSEARRHEGTEARSGELRPPSIREQREALREHFGLAMEVHGEQLAGRRMRKMGIKYARFHPEAAQVKEAFIQTSSLRQWMGVLERWYSSEGAGVWPDARAADEVNETEGCEAG